MWGETAAHEKRVETYLFQSTRPVWGETPLSSKSGTLMAHFNPLAPCGARRGKTVYQLLRDNFNPLAPCGARPLLPASPSTRRAFQSTRPVWGETIDLHAEGTSFLFQSTRPVWGETVWAKYQYSLGQFQSTRPVWGETRSAKEWAARNRISIHSPRVGRDSAAGVTRSDTINFNPLAPCGARPVIVIAPLDLSRFQSTRPVWGETRWGSREWGR